jgi:hypothetical protein
MVKQTRRAIMFGGKILSKTRKQVPGSLRQEAWQDVWKDSIDLFVPEGVNLEDEQVQEAIKEAFYKSCFCQQPESGFGQLRWRGGDSVYEIDVANKQLIISCSVRLCD